MPEKPEEQNKLNIQQLKFIDGLLECNKSNTIKKDKFIRGATR